MDLSNLQRRVLSQPRYMGEGLGQAPNDMTNFEDHSWEASHSLGSRNGMGLRAGVTGEEERETELD